MQLQAAQFFTKQLHTPPSTEELYTVTLGASETVLQATQPTTGHFTSQSSHVKLLRFQFTFIALNT